jgi:hypothetical protein
MHAMTDGRGCISSGAITFGIACSLIKDTIARFAPVGFNMGLSLL